MQDNALLLVWISKTKLELALDAQLSTVHRSMPLSTQMPMQGVRYRAWEAGGDIWWGTISEVRWVWVMSICGSCNSQSRLRFCSMLKNSVWRGYHYSACESWVPHGQPRSAPPEVPIWEVDSVQHYDGALNRILDSWAPASSFCRHSVCDKQQIEFRIQHVLCHFLFSFPEQVLWFLV